MGKQGSSGVQGLYNSNAERPTSGDLKSGDFFGTSTPHN